MQARIYTEQDIYSAIVTAYDYAANKKADLDTTARHILSTLPAAKEQVVGAEEVLEGSYEDYLNKTIQEIKDSKQFLVATKSILVEALQFCLYEYQLR